uniref:Uncharacterized protein n=1 Tax=Phenylobacterium glaciei TaxID=2803784 RepID=A0A974P3S4_9CAUL|nr:hypothetical protein JKL49_04695 [Phenylobacterium glaciei]
MTDRHFSARAVTQGQQRAYDVMGPDFETAAFEFVDRWHPQPDEDGDVEVVVTDTETGNATASASTWGRARRRPAGRARGPSRTRRARSAR